jgi:complex iron-sulfur molybdoenzyme family reductase subunit beta
MYGMVIDLNKCLGCQACTVACKMLWSNRDGAQHMWFTIVETRPGQGYPYNWLEKTKKKMKMDDKDYENVPKFDYSKLHSNKGKGLPNIGINLKNSPNYYEDMGNGMNVADEWFFYLPMICMHCEDPACMKACPAKAIYKTKEGFVLIDSEKCEGAGDCIDACPYKRIFFNKNMDNAEKCIFCFPRLEKGEPPACVITCPGKARFFGKLNDKESPVYKLVKKYKVAVPLLSEFNTKPKVFYIPPVMVAQHKIDDKGNSSGERVDYTYLEGLFGKKVKEIKKILETEREKSQSELVDVLTGFPTWKL